MRTDWVKAILFQIDENFRLKDFEGSFLSMRWHLFTKSAIRFSIGGHFRHSDSTIAEYLSPSDSIIKGIFLRNKSTKITFRLQYELFKYINSHVFTYIAIGPFYQYHKERQRTKILNYKYELPYSNSFGLAFNYGAEIKIINGVSMQLEFGLLGKYNYECFYEIKFDDSQTIISKKKVKNYLIEKDTARLGIVVYL